MTARIDAKDVPAEVLAKLPPSVRKKVRKAARKQRREASFSMEQVRRHALEVLGVVSKLTAAQRDRVLRHALKVNDV